MSEDKEWAGLFRAAIPGGPPMRLGKTPPPLHVPIGDRGALPTIAEMVRQLKRDAAEFRAGLDELERGIADLSRRLDRAKVYYGREQPDGTFEVLWESEANPSTEAGD